MYYGKVVIIQAPLSLTSRYVLLVSYFIDLTCFNLLDST